MTTLIDRPPDHGMSEPCGTCGLSWKERHTALVAEHGKPRTIPDDRAEALRALGSRTEVHPNDVRACAYRDQAAAEAWRASGALHGQPTIGIGELHGEVIAVIDFRPQLAEDGYAPTPPEHPDDWKHGNLHLGQRFETGPDGLIRCAGCGASITDGMMWHTPQCGEKRRAGLDRPLEAAREATA